MDTPEQTTDPVFRDWYRYAAEQPWAVAAYLRLVRLHEFKTGEQQRNEFGVGTDDFLRLHGMPLPRDNAFVIGCCAPPFFFLFRSSSSISRIVASS